MRLVGAFLVAGLSMFGKDVFSAMYVTLLTAKRRGLAGLSDGIGDGLLSFAILSSAPRGFGPHAAAIAGLVAGSAGGTMVGDQLATMVIRHKPSS